ncbi:hypothetical protein BHE74_00020459 [Ensete ventricosum]|nr:hypothetical protein GW17_00019272 [Ensete ventricosum]RWW71780.1 hypothetical protein BHE74_00020459 [Ensete ventricosum]
MEGDGGGGGLREEAGEPRDARVVKELLRSMGLGEGEYEPRVVHQFLELAYRYVVDVLSDAQVYADHASKTAIDPDDVRLAIQSKVNFSFSQPPPRELSGSEVLGNDEEEKQDPVAQDNRTTREHTLATGAGHSHHPQLPATDTEEAASSG